MDEPGGTISQRLALAELYYRLLQDATSMQMTINLRRDFDTKEIYLKRFRPEMIAIFFVVRADQKVYDDKDFMKDMSLWLNANFSHGISRKHYISSLKLFSRLVEKLIDAGLVERC